MSWLDKAIQATEEVMKILCDKCGKPVDLINASHNFESDTNVYTVFCHGESETVTLTSHDMLFITSVEGGVAFVQPKMIGSK